MEALKENMNIALGQKLQSFVFIIGMNKIDGQIVSKSPVRLMC